MNPPRLAVFLFALSFLLLGLAFLTGCAVTYPGKHGNVTLEFTPTPEMLDLAGIKTRTLKDK